MNGTDIAAQTIMKFTSDNGKTLDQAWLNNEIQTYLLNDRGLYDGLKNTRRPAHSVAYDGLIIALNNKLEGHGDLTSRQVQAGFKQLGLDFKEVIKPSVEFVEEERKELQEEGKEIKTENDIKSTHIEIAENGEEVPYLSGWCDEDIDIEDRNDLTTDELWATGWSGVIQNPSDAPFKTFEDMNIACFDNEKGGEYDLPSIPKNIQKEFVEKVNKFIEENPEALDESKNEAKNLKEYNILGMETADEKEAKADSIERGLYSESVEEYDKDFLEYLLHETEINRRGEITYLPDFEDAEMYKDLTEEEYNKTIKHLEEIINNAKFYVVDGGELYIELSDNHTMWDIDNENINLDFYGNYLQPYFDAFEENTGVELFQAGRSGRHIIVKLTIDNLERYNELKQEQEKQEKAFVEEMNNMGKEEESKEVKTESVEYITKEELDAIDDDYKTTVGETIKYAAARGEDEEETRKMYKDLGYEESDPMIQVMTDKGSTLKPVKVKEESVITEDNEVVIVNPDDSDYYDTLYKVSAYPGAGVEMALYKVYADYEEQALSILASYLEKNAPGYLIDPKDVDPELEEDLIYIDGTEYGASQPYFFDYNTRVEEITDIEESKLVEDEEEEDLGDNSDPENKFHNEDGSEKTTLDYLEDRLGQQIKVAEFNNVLQSVFGQFGRIFISNEELFNKDLDERQELVVFVDDDMYVIKYDIIDLDNMNSTIEITDVEID